MLTMMLICSPSAHCSSSKQLDQARKRRLRQEPFFAILPGQLNRFGLHRLEIHTHQYHPLAVHVREADLQAGLRALTPVSAPLGSELYSGRETRASGHIP
jgi:hypothetical protein